MDVTDLYLEERHVTQSGEYDIRTWQMLHSDETRKIATGEVTRSDALKTIKNGIAYESNRLGK